MVRPADYIHPEDEAARREYGSYPWVCSSDEIVYALL